MNSSSYLINERIYTAKKPLVKELAFLKEKNYLFELPHLTMLTIQGNQAASFLQGQLTCDVYPTKEHKLCRGALCNIKGRVQALVEVLFWQEYHLLLPIDLLSPTLNTLKTAAMLSRVQLLPNDHYKIYGLLAQNPKQLSFPLSLPTELSTTIKDHHYISCAIGQNFYLIITTKETAFSLEESFLQTDQLRGSLAWHYLQLKRKYIQIYPQTRGLFLPHRLDLQHLNYISFDKGCYKGQEIIARTHYRAKLKHSLKLFVINTPESLHPGTRLLAITDQKEIGELIDLCPIAPHTYLIAASILTDHPTKVLIEDLSNTVRLENFTE